MRKLLFLLIFLLVHNGWCQGLPIGSWRSHLAYNNGLRCAEVGDRIYVVTSTGMFYITKDPVTFFGLSKADGFSEVDTKTLAYDAQYKTLFVGYQSGNMDVVVDNTIYNVKDLMEKNLLINNFYTYRGFCYISTSEGIVQYNTSRLQFGNTFQYITPKTCSKTNVTSTTILDSFLYATTDSGLLRGNMNSILQDCSNWQKIATDSAGSLTTYQGKVFAAFKGGWLKYWNGSQWTNFYRTADGEIRSIEVDYGNMIAGNSKYIYTLKPDLTVDSTFTNGQNYAIVDADGTVWACTGLYPAIRQKNGKTDYIRPNGPLTNSVGSIYCKGDQVIVSPSTVTLQGAPNYNNDGFSIFSNEAWQTILPAEQTNGFFCQDIMHVIKDTVTGHYWVASLDSGLLEYDLANRKFLNFYNSANSALEVWDTAKASSQVADMKTDQNDNLWVANYRAQHVLAVRKPKGNWYHFEVGANKNVIQLMVDLYGYVWLVAPHDNNVYIYNPGDKIESASDDQVAVLQAGVGNGNLPSSTVNCVALDQGGQVWIGTANGIAVYSDPSLLFNTSRKYDAQQPWITSGGTAGPLLDYVFVSCITVDGANRKWIGTTDGVFLTNEDGTKILEHFNTDNSPLISNTIVAIGINEKTGEVFFGTDKGIVSYRSTATTGQTENSGVYAYPNPVKPGYNGPIAITGLVRNASVKITDVTGNVVYETNALGGQAIWDGKNFKGEEAHSGVYMVFVTNADGSQTVVTKILFVR